MVRDRGRAPPTQESSSSLLPVNQRCGARRLGWHRPCGTPGVSVEAAGAAAATAAAVARPAILTAADAAGGVVVVPGTTTDANCKGTEFTAIGRFVAGRASLWFATVAERNPFFKDGLAMVALVFVQGHGVISR